MEFESEAASVASAAPELHPTTNQTIVAADTFGDHTINEGGVLSIQLRVRGFMRQKADTHKEGVDFRQSFYPSLAAHLPTSGISLSHDAPHRKNTSLKYAKLVGKVRDALASQTLRADRCPQARSDYLNSFVSLNIAGKCWTSPDRTATLLAAQANRALEDATRQAAVDRERLQRQNERVERENSLLREENESLRARLEESERAHQHEIRALTEQLDELARCNGEKDERIAELEASLRAAVVRVDELEKEREKANTSARDSLKRVLELEEKYGRASDAHADLKGEREWLSARLAAREGKVMAQEVELRKLREGLASLEKSRETLSKRLGVALEEREERKRLEMANSWANAAERLKNDEYAKLVKMSLYVKEKYHISDQAFHELWMLY